MHRHALVVASSFLGTFLCPTVALAQQEPPAKPSAAAAAVPVAVPAAEPVIVGEGAHRYRWVPDWGRLGDGKELGSTHGCVAVARDGTIFANTDTEHAVIAFAPDGRILGSWGKEFHGGTHGMCLVEEDGAEVLYLAHTRRHEVVKTTRDGKVLWTLGWPQASGIYENEGQFLPTAVAVAKDGRIFVADGYGKSWVHVFDQDRKYVTSFGGPGTAAGKMQTPHGLWLDARGKEPLLLVCDRENHRLQWFTLHGEHVRTMDKDLRRPCNVAPLPGGGLAVADLAGRVTILDAQDRAVAQLGDQPDEGLRATNGVERAKWQDGRFHAPHGIGAGADGCLYVLEWNTTGRLVKLVPLVPPAKAEPATVEPPAKAETGK
jgi:sugar lactone lactonase YvrE